MNSRDFELTSALTCARRMNPISRRIQI
jgi:hypothetical protein